MTRIAILYTGGTIGMVQGAHGLEPAAGLERHLPALLPEGMAADWYHAEPLIDSSALTLADWQRWLKQIRALLPRYDGLLLLHGTDTLAYTANLLALALPGTGKPLVITGAQWPFGTSGGDAESNLHTALAAFALPQLRQVAVAFDNTLYRAVGSSKVSTETAAAFDTPHFPPLARRLPESTWHDVRLDTLPPVQAAAEPRLDTGMRIVCHTLAPGANSAMIAHSLQYFPADGVVLESYGHGNAPADPALLQAISALSRRGIPVLNISQVAQGCAAAVYAQGNALRQSGAIGGGKANRETAVALLTLAAANGWDHTEIQALLRYWQLL